MSEKVHNLKDVVLPATMVFGILGLAFNAGVQYARVSFMESTQQKMVATIEQIARDLSVTRTEFMVHAAKQDAQKGGVQ